VLLQLLRQRDAAASAAARAEAERLGAPAGAEQDSAEQAILGARALIVIVVAVLTRRVLSSPSQTRKVVAP